MSNYYDPGTGDYVMIDGMMVERDALNIRMKIHEYDENLDVFCIDPALAEMNEAPFILIWKRPDGTWTRVFEFWELDERILERIYNADQHRFDAFSNMTKLEDQLRKQKEDRYKEVREENVEKMAAVFASQQSTYTLPGKNGDLVKHHENQPPTRNKGKRSFSDTGNKFNVKSPR